MTLPDALVPFSRKRQTDPSESRIAHDLGFVNSGSIKDQDFSRAEPRLLFTSVLKADSRSFALISTSTP
jgi:hypothetical protein